MLHLAIFNGFAMQLHVCMYVYMYIYMHRIYHWYILCIVLDSCVVYFAFCCFIYLLQSITRHFVYICYKYIVYIYICVILFVIYVCLMTEIVFDVGVEGQLTYV